GLEILHPPPVRDQNLPPGRKAGRAPPPREVRHSRDQLPLYRVAVPKKFLCSCWCPAAGRENPSQFCGSRSPTRPERVNNSPSQASAPGSGARILVSPKYIENTSARSGVNPWLPNKDTIPRSRRPAPPT